MASLAGVSRNVIAGEPHALTFEDLQLQQTGEATYAANAYTIIHVGRSNQIGEEGSWWRPARGLIYRLDVAPPAFFDGVGRPDLASAASSRHSLAELLVAGGYLTTIAGVLLVPWALYKGNGALAVGGAGLMVGGVVIRFMGEDRRKPAVPEAEAVKLADDYNRGLRRHLNLPDRPVSAAPAEHDSEDAR